MTNTTRPSLADRLSEIVALAEKAIVVRAAFVEHQDRTHGSWPAWCLNCTPLFDAASTVERDAASSPSVVAAMARVAMAANVYRVCLEGQHGRCGSELDAALSALSDVLTEGEK